MMMNMMKRMMCMNPMWMWSMAGCARRPEAKAGSACGSSQAGRKSILETAAGAGSFGTILKALEVSGLGEALKGEGPFTVFAPRDAAFAALPGGTLDDLLKPENRDRLISTLKYHVAPGRILSTEIAGLKAVRTFDGRDVRVRTQGGVVLVDNALVVTPDIRCANGVIHVIDSVLLPA